MISLIINKNKSSELTTFLNPYSYLLLRKKKYNLDSFNIEIDGGILVLLLNLFGINVTRKSFDMTSLAPIVFNEVIDRNKKIYFIGTKSKLIDLAICNISKEYPLLNIVGFRNGYIKPSQKQNVFKKIIDSRADYVICGMGTPLQENFLYELKSSGWIGKGYTCGGFLHQTSSGMAYYPKWINKLGLRAFYRMIDEPKLISRYFIDYPKAIFVILYDIIKYKFIKK